MTYIAWMLIWIISQICDVQSKKLLPKAFNMVLPLKPVVPSTGILLIIKVNSTISWSIIMRGFWTSLVPYFHHNIEIIKQMTTSVASWHINGTIFSKMQALLGTKNSVKPIPLHPKYITVLIFNLLPFWLNFLFFKSNLRTSIQMSSWAQRGNMMIPMVMIPTNLFSLLLCLIMLHCHCLCQQSWIFQKVRQPLPW